VVTEDVASAIEPGDHGSTFAANALISRVAQVVVKRVSNPDFLRHVREIGEYLGQQLRALAARKPNVVEARGMGLIWALELTDEAAPYVAQGYQEGAIMLVAGPKVLRFLPPLVIGREHVDEMISILDRVLPD
jgi:acetylornithine/N-succinyldiaminopimelate aminotransferase